MPALADRRITASHLYDMALCEHRVGLDFTVDRSLRTPPSEAQRLLIEKGRAVEAEVAAVLGYAAVASSPDDYSGAFERTQALMRDGVPGIYQGVLMWDRYLAIPDLLRRVEGRSRLGDFHYEAGDIKSSLKARTDQALQVVFSARLLEKIQGVRPDRGFLRLADGREAAFSLLEVWDAADQALASLERIADGQRATAPFLADACGRCRWRGTCLPQLSQGPDLSFVAGMTRTRRRILFRAGVRTLAGLAALDRRVRTSLEVSSLAFEGLSALQKQARALATGRTVGGAARVSPHSGPGLREHFLIAMRDPLDDGDPFLFGWGARRKGQAALERSETLWAAPADGGEPGLDRLLARLDASAAGRAGGTIFHFGASAPRCFALMADRSALDPAIQARIEGRFFDLAPAVRSRGYLPVRRYSFEEVASVVRGRPLPPLDGGDDEPFVLHENHRLGVPGDWHGRLRGRVDEQLSDLAALRDWLAAAQPVRNQASS